MTDSADYRGKSAKRAEDAERAKNAESAKKFSIVLASGNAHKYGEFAVFFRQFESLELLGGGDFTDSPGDIEETGSSYEENALIKARAWADFTNMPAMADDSGIEVRALGWRPGIFSSRAAPGGDAGRIGWLMGEMDGQSDRRACFVACLVVAAPSFGQAYRRGRRDYFAAEARCWGRIALAPSGASGFGYDPVFIPDGRDGTFADLGPDVKSKISHRAVAMRGVAQMLPVMLKYFSTCDKFRARSDERGSWTYD